VPSHSKSALAWSVAVALAGTLPGCSKQSTAPPSVDFNVTLNTSPLFESAKGWGRENPGGAVVGPGADNKNVLSQRVAVYPGEPLKIVAQAASAGQPTGYGRLQINWVDGHEHQISVSGKEIPLTSESKRFELPVTPPAGAAAGYLYVSPHGPKDVVRYTEMRLLTTACDKAAEPDAAIPGGCTRLQPPG
jgi:hypothetical protein